MGNALMDELWVRSMERRMAIVETFVKEIRENHLPHISSELLWIRGRLNRGSRPTYSILTLVSILGAIVAGFVVYGVMR